MGFRVISSPIEAEYEDIVISSQTVTANSLLEQVSGATSWTVCTLTSTHFTPKAIASAAASSSATSVHARLVTGFELVEAEVTETASSDDDGDLMVLTDLDTVNNTGTTSSTEYATFRQKKVGSTTSTIVGKILVGNGVNPDATT